MYVVRVTELWILAVGDADSLRDIVAARFETGPFAPCDEDDDEICVRKLEIGDGWICERGGGYLGERDFLARHVAAATREPVILQQPEKSRAYEIAPGDDPAAKLREVELRPAIDGVPVHRLAYTIDLAKHDAVEHAFIRGVEATVKAQFPIHNRQKTARLDCKRLDAYERPESSVRYRYLKAELQLALYEWSADGNERSMIELRKGASEIGRYFMLIDRLVMSDARGNKHLIVYDEYVAAFHASITRHLRRIQKAMDRTDWTGVTVESLVEREYR